MELKCPEPLSQHKYLVPGSLCSSPPPGQLCPVSLMTMWAVNPSTHVPAPRHRALGLSQMAPRKGALQGDNQSPGCSGTPTASQIAMITGQKRELLLPPTRSLCPLHKALLEHTHRVSFHPQNKQHPLQKWVKEAADFKD